MNNTAPDTVLDHTDDDSPVLEVSIRVDLVTPALRERVLDEIESLLTSLQEQHRVVEDHTVVAHRDW